MVSIYTNTAANRIVFNLNLITTDIQRVTQRLSSGVRLPSEAPANYAAATSFATRARAFQAADTNIQIGVSALDTADASLQQVSDTYLPRLIELATTAANGLTTDAQRVALDAEFQSIKTTINSLVAATRFNSFSLLDGTAGSFQLQVGPEATTTYTVDFSTDFRTTAAVGEPLANLGASGAGLRLNNQANAQAALTALSGGAPPTVQSEFTSARAQLGAQRPALEGLSDYVQAARIEALDSEIAFIGADMAADASRLIRDQLLSSSGSSALQAASFSAASIVSALGNAVNRSL